MDLFMDIRSLTVIKAILSEGSFQKAAQRLNCSQSTVTFQVRLLENELSLRLFERFGRRMVLSQAGKAILPHMEAILRSMEAIKACGSGQRQLCGELRIAVAESLLSYKLHTLLGSFVRQAPKVRIELHSLNCHDIKNGILAGDYDMGVYYDIGGHPDTLTLTPLGDAEGILVASPALPPELRDFDSPNQYKDVSLVINEPRSVYRERVESYLRARNILLRSTIELWSIEAIKKCVASNLGVSFLPRFAVEQELAQGSLIALPVAIPDNRIRMIAVHHRNRTFSPAMRLFEQLLKSGLACGETPPTALP